MISKADTQSEGAEKAVQDIRRASYHAADSIHA